jgi:hypothetical protein
MGNTDSPFKARRHSVHTSSTRTQDIIVDTEAPQNATLAVSLAHLLISWSLRLASSDDIGIWPDISSPLR